MKQFTLKVLLFLSPLLIAVVLYVTIDPFKVIYDYPEMVNTKADYQPALNRDYQTTELYLRNYKTQHYDSFIFGNSRSFFYQAATWKKLVHGNIFHFNASSEGIFGINGKLKLLTRKKSAIKNALIIIDANALTKTENSSGHLFIKHPEVSGESWFAFQKEMAVPFFSPAMVAFTDLYVTKKYKPYMKSFGISKRVWKLDNRTNQLAYDVYDRQLAQNPDAYYADKRSVFFKRPTVETVAYPRLNIIERQAILKNIHKILQAHHTDYKIIISPLYNQEKMHPDDVKYLRNLFGAAHVFDFSGKNKLTEPYTNYYEDSHYRPKICDAILYYIYGRKHC